MGVYIKGMDMPSSCFDCLSTDLPWVVHCEREKTSCPLVEVPTPHGRLIDAEDLEVIAYTDTEGRANTFDDGVMWLAEQIDNAPTVIESED